MQKQGQATTPRHPQGHYSAYVDGSLFDSGQNAGAGWVIFCHQSDNLVESESRRIDEIARGTSTIAEIYAAASALGAIAAGSHITLHSDDQDLCTVLQNNVLHDRIQRNGGKPLLQRAYSELFNAVARHEQIIAVKAHIDDSPYMRLAHHLAREGAKSNVYPLLPPPPRPPAL